VQVLPDEKLDLLLAAGGGGGSSALRATPQSITLVQSAGGVAPVGRGTSALATDDNTPGMVTMTTTAFLLLVKLINIKPG